ncbi:hypothetical protein [Mycobacterium sp. TY815]|uniref:hypothetical protein n=1 Tax=Mycobacterium sp. TY815 TaxID=3050581 RepID=UPI0027409A39|nr:hypothetical protein [Mycobacterium sp. TY815]MDP7703209.1 hypothetical protein [Mycobacterium sp. TY815]
MQDDIIAAVAQAIWQADPFKMGDPDTWTGSGEQAYYLSMARNAIDALGLQVQWGWQLGDNTPSVYPTEQQARDRVTYLDSVFQVGTKRHVVHRLTTPWTRDTTDAPATT